MGLRRLQRRGPWPHLDHTGRGEGREGEIRRIADRSDLVPGTSVNAVFNPIRDHFGVERRGGDVNPIRAHLDSYVNEDLWRGVDALGHTNGNATLEFRPNNRRFFRAPVEGPLLGRDVFDQPLTV